MNSKTGKRTVEDCLKLDISVFAKKGVLESTPGTGGVLYLPHRANNVLSVVPYELVQPSPGRLGLRVDYLHISGSGSTLVDYVIELLGSSPYKIAEA